MLMDSGWPWCESVRNTAHLEIKDTFSNNSILGFYMFAGKLCIRWLLPLARHFIARNCAIIAKKEAIKY